MEYRKYDIYEFPECKGVVVSGDIHGDFNILVNKICVQYQMRDTLVIVAGDCGFGFEKKGYYDNVVKRNAKRMDDANIWIVFIRGNHDNPAYFDGKAFKHKRFIAIPDYSIINVCNHSILCVGGAISIDRTYRMEAWSSILQKRLRFGHTEDGGDFFPAYYWQNEFPVYRDEVLRMILSEQKIDTVITHTCPSFCEPQSKGGIERWAATDKSLMEDVLQERNVMDSIYKALKECHQQVSHWCYGHFHQSCSSSIDGTLFKMLDIMELYLLQ